MVYTQSTSSEISGTGAFVVCIRLFDLFHAFPAASRAPENTPAMVKKIGKTTYKVRVHFSQTSTETMSDKIKRMLKNEIQNKQL